jgi:ATP-binding cassette subfamily B protein
VGATGAGKTSIINLICGFYENQKGQILIDGIDIRKMSKNRLRRNIGLVLQDVFLFSGNIETNIKLFDESIDFDKVKQASEYVNADSFIERLPEAYKSIVSEKGNTFSMGERQLISFARAIVRNPKILVMDEATSSIDTETENLVQEALAKIMKDRTTIAIAHRLSTIQKADIIIVIHKGEIAELGNHKELIGQKGMYYKLYELQYVD